ncbi:MAG TPA: hypothetical protein GXX18_02485 [Bacillales bacterium]|nr:hypothetical protein [Bacillales bacterium]
MAPSIVPESYSNVIYLQPSFSFIQENFSSLRHLPYVKLALDFPWEQVFAPIEQEYIQARFERNKKLQKCFDSNECFSAKRKIQVLFRLITQKYGMLKSPVAL